MSLDPATSMVLAPDEGEGHRQSLLALLQELRATGYRFVTATPNTHARVISRPDRQRARTLRDVLGWSLPFTPDIIPARILDLMHAAGAIVEHDDGMLRSRLRVSSAGDTLCLHSAYPTTAQDAVFFGPDSYRFADLILARMPDLRADARILDYAAGTGVGGITAAMRQPQASLTLADINSKALFLASINAEHAGLQARTVQATTPADLPDTFDLIVTHPPFMIDTESRAYRDGGDLYGARLSLDWVLAGAAKLAPGGRLILHTGVSIVDGQDVLRPHLEKALPHLGCTLWYHELDVDIFGDELDNAGYADVERIAAIGACVTRNVE